MANYKSKYKGQQIDNLLDFVNTNKDNIAMQSDIPAVPSDISDFNNDSGFIDNTVNNLVNYYLKTETYTQSEINALVSAAASGGFVKVNELPTTGINVKAIYLVPYTGSRAKNLYEEYIYIDGDWEMIGTTKIDLSNYITTEALTTALQDYVLSTDLDSLIADYYTKTEIDNIIGDLDDLQTTHKTNLVEAINEANTNGSSSGGGTTYTAGDGISINNDEISIDPMPSEDMDSIFDELPAGGNIAVTGYVPLGTLIPYYGETAPKFFLACDGSTYNKADYPELANHLLSLTNNTSYIVDGDDTKFKVPDLRGEFLRGTGTNSHENQGSGGDIGEHQDSTSLPNLFVASNGIVYGLGSSSVSAENIDGTVQGDTTKYRYNGTSTTTSTRASSPIDITIRPTNTSVLYCIAYKDIYSNPMNDYSTDEKVVGTWINGKPLYQKTIVDTMPEYTSGDMATKTIQLSLGIDIVIYYNVIMYGINNKNTRELPASGTVGFDITTEAFINSVGEFRLNSKESSHNGKTVYITLRYTKTTD